MVTKTGVQPVEMEDFLQQAESCRVVQSRVESSRIESNRVSIESNRIKSKNFHVAHVTYSSLPGFACSTARRSSSSS